MERAEQLAAFFHQTYERLAPEFGYETRPESAVPWPLVPEQNRKLMTAVCQEIIDREQAAEQAVSQVRQAADDFRAEYGDADIDTFVSWLQQKQAQGWPPKLLLKMAVVSINALFSAADRWNRLEGGRTNSAPIWLDRVERDALLAATRGRKSTTLRVVRASLKEMLPGGPL